MGDLSLAPEHLERIAGLLPAGLPVDELLESADFARNFRLAERAADHLLLLDWSGAVVRAEVSAGQLGAHRVERVREVPPAGARPGRPEMPIAVRTWGEAMAVLADDAAVATWSDALPDELEVHAKDREGPVVYRFAVADRASLEARDPYDLGAGRSTVLDAVGWRDLAEKLEESGGDRRLALAAWEQALRFVEGDAVPTERGAFFGPSTHRFRSRFPAEFTKAALERRRDLARQRAGDP